MSATQARTGGASKIWRERKEYKNNSKRTCSLGMHSVFLSDYLNFTRLVLLPMRGLLSWYEIFFLLLICYRNQMKAHLLMNSESQDTLLEDIGSQVSFGQHVK